MLPADIEREVRSALRAQPIIDMHTHLYPPSFGTPNPNATGKTEADGLMLWGVDELLTYHYLIAEVYRVVPATKLPYSTFWKMTTEQKADHIFQHLFLERSPISEACRGVLTSLQKLGIDTGDKNLKGWRNWFAKQDPDKYIDKVMELSNVSSITMTNAVFDDVERKRWEANPNVGSDSRFRAVLRIDPFLLDWPTASKKLAGWGFDVQPDLGGKSIAEGKRFLQHWIDKMKAIYLAVSLGPDWRFPADDKNRAGQTVLEKIVLPICEANNLPFAMMIGARRDVNPGLQGGGDSTGLADVASIETLCRTFPNNRFFVTLLAREAQHALAVAARKFGNLMVFGCWWFLNNPSLIEEITRFRLELLGTSVIPQHSDARVLDQLLYKWEHSREILARVITDKFQDLGKTGWPVSVEEIRRTVKQYLASNFEEFLKG